MPVTVEAYATNGALLVYEPDTVYSKVHENKSRTYTVASTPAVTI